MPSSRERLLSSDLHLLEFSSQSSCFAHPWQHHNPTVYWIKHQSLTSSSEPLFSTHLNMPNHFIIPKLLKFSWNYELGKAFPTTYTTICAPSLKDSIDLLISNNKLHSMTPFSSFKCQQIGPLSLCLILEWTLHYHILQCVQSFQARFFNSQFETISCNLAFLTFLHFSLCGEHNGKCC